MNAVDFSEGLVHFFIAIGNPQAVNFDTFYSTQGSQLLASSLTDCPSDSTFRAQNSSQLYTFDAPDSSFVFIRTHHLRVFSIAIRM